MRDVILATVECARWDYRESLGPDRDLKTSKAITAGHYTRPSLAGLLSPSYESVAASEVRETTLADALSDAGYRTVAISYSPQTTPAFGFDRGFDDAYMLDADGGPLRRGSRLRERLARVGAVRWLKRRFQDKHATFDHVPRDRTVVNAAKRELRRSDEPLFLWVHFMGSHRPYGWAGDAMPADLSRRMAAAGPGEDSEELRSSVEPYYTQALQRVRGHLSELLDAAPDDAAVVVCGDHGEELGEDGYFLHAGHRQRVVDTLVEVPVFARNVPVPTDTFSLIDLPLFFLSVTDADPPEAWVCKPDRDHYLTLAPWHDTATVRYQTDAVDLRFEDACLPRVRKVSSSRDVEAQLQALGYRGVG